MLPKETRIFDGSSMWQLNIAAHKCSMMSWVQDHSFRLLKIFMNVTIRWVACIKQTKVLFQASYMIPWVYQDWFINVEPWLEHGEMAPLMCTPSLEKCLQDLCLKRTNCSTGAPVIQGSISQAVWEQCHRRANGHVTVFTLIPIWDKFNGNSHF